MQDKDNVEDVDYEELDNDSENKNKAPAKVFRKPLNNKDTESEVSDKTKTVNPEDYNDKKKKSEKVDVNFGDASSLRGFVEKKSSEENESDENEEINYDGDGDEEGNIYTGEKKTLGDKTAEEIREEISKAEEEEIGVDEATDIAEFVINLFDSAVSTVCRFIAKDTSDHAYNITKKKKDNLEKLLAKIIIKYQFKLKIELVFIATLIVVYSVPVQKAIKERKKDQKERKQGKPRQ